jgi:SAM-dependent methyltransferase
MTPTGGVSSAVLDRAQADRWRASWAQVMGGFVPGLATLEEMICRAAESRRHGSPRRVLDLGGGPGVLAQRMALRWPGAEVTLMDIDPVLLALAREGAGDVVRTLDGDICSPAWVGDVGDGYDVIVMVMTLHYLPSENARAWYDDVRRALAPGGLLVVADLMPDDGIATLMSALDPADGEAAAELAWAQWWNDVAQVRPIRPLMDARTAVFRERPPAEFTAPVSWHVAAAHDAGFRETGLLWRCGRHAALAAIA